MSTGIQISGLASGFDWSSLITSLINVDRVPEARWKSQQATNNNQLTAYTTLGSQLKALQASVTALQESSLFAAHTATPGNAALGWTASASANTPNGVYSVNVSQLATATARTGAGNIGAGLNATASVSGLTVGTLATATAVTAGSFQINGAPVAVLLTDSLQDVFDKIHTATGTHVTASYAPGTDKVSLHSDDGTPVVLGAANDTSNFLTVLGLASNGAATVSSGTSLGVTQLNQPIANSHLLAAIGNTDVDGNGSFQINGVPFAFNVGTDSIQTVLNNINGSTAGVTAAYDVSHDRFTLTNNVTGNLALSATETGNGLLKAMGLGSTATAVGGLDAIHSVNGGTNVFTHGNSFTDSSGLSVTASTLDTQSITVGTDATAATAAINDFITKFNAVESSITQGTAVHVNADNSVSSAVFAGNHNVSGLGSGLRAVVFGSVPGLGGSSPMRLQSMGIDFIPGTSTLAVTNSAVLANALATNGANVANLFQNSTNGLTAKLQTFITKTTGTTGLLAIATATLNARNTSLAAQIAALERHLTAEHASLTSQFTMMEQMQARFKNQAQALTNAFGGSNSSSNNSNSGTTVNNGSSNGG